MSISNVLENLEEAIIGESTAKFKYDLFSKKAEQEGYKEISHVFQAISKAEEIHIKNHLKAYEKIAGENFDAKILSDINEPNLQNSVKDTRSNLIQAISGETYEFQKMYKSFIKTAKKLNEYLAEFSFNLARNAENVHRKIFIDFLNKFDASESIEEIDIYICKICGNVVFNDVPSKCPLCDHNKIFFERI